jgi:ATP-binding cassette subfamily C protein
LPDDTGGNGIVLQIGVEFRQVSFIYHSAPEKYAIKSADFSLPVGTTTALVGASGAGKTTLIDLLMGLLTPTEGDILLDGRPVGEKLRPWRRSIGYVSQDPFLINNSIRGNLLWACPGASEEDMWAALTMAAADGFVRGLPSGLDSVVGDRGVRISGGERQRIVLARALLKKPSVLILDEATSSLDSENEQSIQRAIEGLKGKLTIVVIAHRISTVKNVDQILVVEQGQIIEQGNYQFLIKNKTGRFYALACSSVTDNAAESVGMCMKKEKNRQHKTKYNKKGQTSYGDRSFV